MSDGCERHKPGETGLILGPMTGTICLQGGGEFSTGCREMDADLIRRAGGRIVVTALAGTKGADYRSATERGVQHFRDLGARDVVAAPDVRENLAGALTVLETARLIVLPGGSPSRLLAALTSTPVGQAIADLLAEEGVVMGASAGAMVLGTWTVLPDAADGMALANGLGLVGDLLVIPHWTGEAGRQDWLQLPQSKIPDTVILGIPEESGILLQDGVLTAVGRSGTTVLDMQAAQQRREFLPGQTWEHR